MSEKFRVIRVLEYEYENFEAYQKDRELWTHSIVGGEGGDMTMRSISFDASLISVDDEDVTDVAES